MTAAHRYECAAPDCTDRRRCGEYCRLHYARWKRTGSTERAYRPNPVDCSTPGCTDRARVKGLCRLHYGRWSRTGTTELPAKPDRCQVGHYCPEPVHAKGLCRNHYTVDLRRRRAAGEPIRKVRPKWAA